MALTGTLHADFAEFTVACQKAKADLVALEAQAGTVGPAINQMVATSASGLTAMHAPAEAFGTTLVSAADVAQQSFVKLPGIFSEVRGGLNEVAAGAGLTVEGLGLFSAAGLVAGTAMASWKLTRAAMEFLGLDDAVAKAWTHLLGFNDAVTAGAAAKLDVLARASQTAGREITDMAEAMRINQKAFDDWNAGLLRARGPEESRLQIEHWQQEIDKVVKAGALAGLTRDVQSHNFSQKELGDWYQISTGAIGMFTKELDADAKAVTAWGKEQQDMAKAAAAAHKAAVEVELAELKIMDAFRADAHKRQVEIIRVQTDEQTKAAGIVNAAIKAEFDAQVTLNAEWGLNASGALKLQHTALDTLNTGLEALHAKKVEGISQEKEEQVLMNAYTRSLYDAAAAAESSGARQVAAINGVTRSLNAQIDAAFAAAQAAAALIGMNIASVGQRPGEGPGINGAPPPSTFSLGPGITLGPGAAGIRAGGASTGGSVVNHIYVNGTAEDVARTIADKVLRTVMQTRKLGSA
jgi:hypothetical protein